jgi:hypothetical protein
MSTATATASTNTTSAGRVSQRRLLAVNLGATVAAGAATEAWVAIARATGVHLAVGDPFGDPSSAVPITAGACAVSIAMCMVLGAALAALLNWRSARPARTYVAIAGALTFISLGAPLVSAGASTATKVTLIVAHLVAAAVIIPLVARCLAQRS